MKTLYRIRYRIEEAKSSRGGTILVEETVEQFIEAKRKEHRDATYMYFELVETIEREDDSSTARESIIIMGWDEYETFYG